MRVALVGCGQIAKVHLSALRGIENLEIGAVCDQDKWRAEELGKLAGDANAYNNLEALLTQENLDAVHILTPPETHAELAIRAMEAGCHVLVEKPMAVSLKQAESMVSVARDNRVKLCTNHNCLYKPSVIRARQLIDSGAIGEVVCVNSYYGLSGERSSYADNGGRSHWAWRLPGGILTDFLPHLIYLQLAFLQRVDSVVGVAVLPQGNHFERATELTALLQGSGVTGTMCISMRSKPYAKYVEVYGTKGIVHADLVREVCTIHKERKLPRMISKAIFNIEESVQLAYGTAVNTVKVAVGRLKNYPGLHNLVVEFYNSIRSHREPPVTGEDGRKMLEVMERIWARSRSQHSYTPVTATITADIYPKTDHKNKLAKNTAMPGKVLVTGATGFLGYHLVSKLSKCGADVVALVRDRNRISQHLKNQAKIVSGDLRDPASIEAAVKDVAVIYHCAAVTTNRTSWTAHHEINVRGTETLFKAALKNGLQRVIHVSSVVVYGMNRFGDTGLLTESSPYDQRPGEWDYYLRSKLEADKLAFRYWQQDGLPVTVARLGILYGPGGGRSIVRTLGQFGRVQLLIGKGRNLLPFIYVDNATDCLLLAATAKEALGQAYNVVDEPQISVRDIAVKSQEITGEKPILVSVPLFLLVAGAALLEWKHGIRDKDCPPRLSSFVVRSASRNIRYDTTKARAQLGWQPEVSLEEGMRRTFQEKHTVC